MYVINNNNNNNNNNYQLLDEAEYDMKNYADRGGCYPPKPKAEADNTLRNLIRKPNSIIALLFIQNISRALKIYKKIFKLGFVGFTEKSLAT